MLKKTWDNIEIILITLSILIAMFTVGLMVGVYISSENVEKLSSENIRQYQTIQQQKERIRELQEMKQLKEIYTKLNEEDVYLITFVWTICRICLTFENRR